MSSFLDGLNDAQRAAVAHTGSPLLVLAGAGSGKTRVLTHKISHIICSQNVSPHQILAVTFTNKAAGEMRERIARFLGHSQAPAFGNDLWVGTFHAIGLRIIRQHAAKLGYGGEIVVYDSGDQQDLVKACLKAMNWDAKNISPSAIAAFINRVKCAPDGLASLDGRQLNYFEQQAKEVFARYEALLRQNQALDFSDLLQKPLELFEKVPNVLEDYQDRFRYIFVDEYQDTNRVQYAFLKALSAAGAELCVVGDEDQSIYRFRGANIRNILDFQNDFPDATVIRLEQNYRSTQNILHAANSVVAHNTERLGKTLWSKNTAGDPITLYTARDDRDEAAFVVGEILKLSSRTSLDQIAIFYRTNAQSRVLEEECRRHNLAYRIYGGQNFFERKEVKDIIAYLRLVANPRDSVSFKRVVNVPARGIGKTSLDRLEALAMDRHASMLELIAQNPNLLGTRVRPPFERFVALYSRLYSLHGDHSSLAQFVKTLIAETGYEAMLRGEGDYEAESRLENLDEFLNAVADYEARTSTPSLSHFLEQITLDGSTPEGDDTSTRPLPLMTLHLAKGLEFPYVFIVGLEENLLPHVRSLEAGEEVEEERRLIYVGMTRAMKQLTLSHALKRYAHGREEHNLPSRFLNELPAEILVERGLPHHSGFSQTLQPDHDTEEVFYLRTSGPYVVGKLVRHPQFGRGVIRGLDGDGDNPKVTILFENGQMKKLLGKYAHLEVL